MLFVTSNIHLHENSLDNHCHDDKPIYLQVSDLALYQCSTHRTTNEIPIAILASILILSFEMPYNTKKHFQAKVKIIVRMMVLQTGSFQ